LEIIDGKKCNENTATHENIKRTQEKVFILTAI
jgi:hypothetical protein